MTARFAAKSREKGAEIVEAALVMLLVLIILIGIIDIGLALVLHQALEERVRAGARYAAVNPWNPNLAKNVVLYNKLDTAAPSGMGLFGITPSYGIGHAT